MRASQPSFAAGEVSPEIAARMDVAKYGSALRTARNVIGLREGGVTNRPGMQLVGQVRNSTDPVRLIPFQFSADQAYALEFAWARVRVILNGAYVTTTPKVILGIASPLVLHVTAHGWTLNQHVFLTGIGGALDDDGLSGLNGRTFRVGTVVDADHVALIKMDGHDIDIADYTAVSLTGSSTAAGIFELATPYLTNSDLAQVRYEQSADVMYLAHPAYPLQKLSRTDHTVWTIEAVDFFSHTKPPTVNTTATPTTGSGTATLVPQSYRVSGINDDTGQESLISTATATASNDLTLVGSYNTITWTAPAAATGYDLPTRYIVYKESNGLYGYIGSTEGLTFKDNNIDPDLGTSPQINSDPLSGTGNYPDALGFYQQRLFTAGTDNKPNGVWGSRSGDFENMNYSRPLREDDGLSFGISARQVNRVLHIVPMSDLLAFTSESVFRITGATSGDAIGPTSVSVKPQVHRGSSNARPVVIDETVLYVTAKGGKLRNLGYQFASDAWQGTDLTILSNHLFKGKRVVETAWCEYPHSAVFCLLDDGTLLALTWMPEQEVSGWSVIETDGLVKSICTVTENGRDSLYLVVRRDRAVGGGGNFSYVERLAMPYETGQDIAGACYLDGAVSYSGAPATVLSGMEHLEGRTVNALVDGNVTTGLVVADGKVTLSQPASVATVGIPYTSTIKTLPVAVQNSAGKRQSVSKAVVRLLDTRGIKVGVVASRLEPPKPRVNEEWGDPADLITGDAEVVFDTIWTSDNGIIVQQADPLPMTVLGVYPDVQVGG